MRLGQSTMKISPTNVVKLVSKEAGEVMLPICQIRCYFQFHMKITGRYQSINFLLTRTVYLRVTRHFKIYTTLFKYVANNVIHVYIQSSSRVNSIVFFFFFFFLYMKSFIAKRVKRHF